jgi:CBS domain-containing protein
MKVKDIMTQDVVCAAPDTRLGDIAQMMVEHDCGAIPIAERSDARRLVGMVTDRDIVCRVVAEGRNPHDMTAREIMSSPVRGVSPDDDIEQCCRVMEREQVRRAPVFQTDGTCCGIVSQADIALHAPEHETAELVHEVSRGRQTAKAI